MRSAASGIAQLCLAMLATCIVAPTRGAIAPDTVVGKVFRPGAAITSTRAALFSVTQFLPDGGYSDILTAGGSVLDNSYGVTWKLGVPDEPVDGTYVYTRTDDSHATLVKTRPDGATETYTLVFESPTSGTASCTWSAHYGQLNPGPFVLLDVTAYRDTPLINTSTRGWVSPGKPVITGFVIPGKNARLVLVRAVGPGLERFGVEGFWADPDFQVFRGETRIDVSATIQPIARHYGDWSLDPVRPPGRAELAFERLFAFAGAFPLPSGSKDAAQVLQLAPGAYTVVASAAEEDAGGNVLIEVYLLP